VRLFWSIVGIEARKRMSYRVDFWINSVVGFVTELGVAWFIVLAMFSGADRIGGFSRDGMLLYYVAIILIARLVRSTDLEWAIADDIYQGALSRYLLYPVTYGVLKYATQIGALLPAIVQVTLFGAWIPFVLGIPEGVRLTPATVAMCAGAIAVANALHFLSTYPIQLVAFWADNCWSLLVAHRLVAMLLGGILVPLALFPAWSQPALNALPYRYMFAFPVDALLGRLSVAEYAAGLGVAVAWCGIFAAVSAAVWRRGTLQYTGVGM
jgi:ABC-2 type transport system permease protein